LRERGRRHGRLQHGYSDDWQRSSETRNEETLTRLSLGCYDRVCVRHTAIADKIASAGVLVMLPVLALTFFVRNHLVSGLMAGGVKE
jgi:ABC-type glycerol-3-phosphate transport system permease component